MRDITKHTLDKQKKMVIFHSNFKAQLHHDEKSTMNITKQSLLSKLLQKDKLLLIEEVTILNKF